MGDRRLFRMDGHALVLPSSVNVGLLRGLRSCVESLLARGGRCAGWVARSRYAGVTSRRTRGETAADRPNGGLWPTTNSPLSPTRRPMTTPGASLADSAAPYADTTPPPSTTYATSSNRYSHEPIATTPTHPSARSPGPPTPGAPSPHAWRPPSNWKSSSR
jgi:hypothetical protein